MAQSQIKTPSLEELVAAYKAPTGTYDPTKDTNAFIVGSTLPDIIAQKHLERQKAEQDLQKEIFAVKEQAAKKSEEDKAAQLLQPVTAKTPLSTMVPATAGNVANVNPEPTAQPLPQGQQGPAEQTNQVMQGPSDIQAQLESQRIPALKGNLLKIAPEQMAASLSGVQKNPIMAINQQTGATRIVIPDATGNLNLMPGEQVKDLAVAEKRAAPFVERNKIMAQQLAQRGDFKSADLATRLGQSLSTGSLHGSDQVAAKNLDQITRTRQLVQQTRQEQGDTITPQQVQELALGTARAITGQSVVARETIDGLLPGTLKEKYGSAAQFFLSKPNPVDIHEFVTNLDNTLAREGNINKGIVVKAIKKNTSGLGQSLLKMNPEAYYQTLSDARSELGDDVIDAVINERQNPVNYREKPESPAAPSNPGDNPQIHALAAVLGLKRKGGK